MRESEYFLEHPANLNEQDIRILLEIENEAELSFKYEGIMKLRLECFGEEDF